MAVPETAMDQDNRVMPRHHDVRRAGKIGAMKAEPQSEPVQELGLCKLLPIAGRVSSQRPLD